MATALRGFSCLRAPKLGLASTSVANTPEALAAELEAGHPIICNMAPGIFTKVGHYIAIEGLDDKGKALVHDSNSRATVSGTGTSQLSASRRVPSGASR